MRFIDIPGQRDIHNRLTRAVLEGRVSHAQLFLGGEGTFKLATAIAFSRFLLCSNRTQIDTDGLEYDSCGTCPSCQKFDKLAHPDLHFIYPVANTKELKKAVSDDFSDEWRSISTENESFFTLTDWYKKIGVENKQPIINAEDCNNVIKKLSYKSYEGEFKIMLMWRVEKLYHAAAPRILKILEEPPEKTVFILIAENQDQILNTILSRTQRIKFPSLKEAEVKRFLQKRFEGSNDLDRVAHMAEGNVHAAMQLISQNEELEYNFTKFRHWLRLVFKPRASMADIVRFSDEMAGIGRERQKSFFQYGLHVARQALQIGMLGKEIPFQNDEADFLKKVSPFFHSGNIVQIEKELNQAIYHVERNANPKILFTDLSLTMAGLIKLPKDA